MRHPFPRTWWITDGRVLGGRFPGAPVQAEVAPRLNALLDVGVTQVVCLQEADERGSGGRPFAWYDAELLRLGESRGVAVAWVRFAVVDMAVPPVATVRAVLDRIEANVGVTYLHCWGGHGRTGTVAGCWLREQGLTSEAAFAHIRVARSHDDHLARQPAPQTAAQRQRVEMWLGR